MRISDWSSDVCSSDLADGLRGDMTSLNFSQKFSALDHLESVRIYITHGLAGRENQMPRPRISAGAAVFHIAIMAVSVFNHDDIAAIVPQALLARQFHHFPSRAVTHSNASTEEHTA